MFTPDTKQTSGVLTVMHMSLGQFLAHDNERTAVVKLSKNKDGELHVHLAGGLKSSLLMTCDDILFEAFFNPLKRCSGCITQLLRVSAPLV